MMISPINGIYVYCSLAIYLFYCNNKEGRIKNIKIFLLNQTEVVLFDMEAARYMYIKKTGDGHLNCCIELEDILVFLVKNTTTFRHKIVEVLMAQIISI